MNFGREQALLKQRLGAVATPAQAAEKEAEHGGEQSYLGAPDAEVEAAAMDLCAAYPEMGRAQMTAFVRTLWQSKVHELRQVGVTILAERAQLLEPHDLPFVETLLKDQSGSAHTARLAAQVLGPLVGKNKKLWKDLQKLAQSANERLRRAAVHATKAPLSSDGTVFDRFEKLVTPLLAEADQLLQKAIDDVLVAAAAQAGDQVRAFADEHGRKVKLPKAKPAKTVEVASPKAPPKATARKAAPKKSAKKPAAPARRKAAK
ncbi:MAG: DNA alkylation repair protein [Planctomycetes bacterium]|nr:DNA alkylation repair protein [Planctomycetota bacterium]